MFASISCQYPEIEGGSSVTNAHQNIILHLGRLSESHPGLRRHLGAVWPALKSGGALHHHPDAHHRWHFYHHVQYDHRSRPVQPSIC